MNLDKTFCGSPGCENKCGRRLPEEYRYDVWKDPANVQGKLISFAYFCGEPDNTHVVNTFEKPVEKSE